MEKERVTEKTSCFFYCILTGHTMRSKFDHKLLLDHFHKSLSAMSLFSLFVFLLLQLLLLLPQAYSWQFACKWIWSIILLWTHIKAKKNYEFDEKSDLWVTKQNKTKITIAWVIHVEMCAKSDKDKYGKWFHSMAKLYMAWQQSK